MSTNLVTKDPKKSKQIINTISEIINSFLSAEKRDGEEDFYKTVMQAKQELIDSQLYFDSVTDPELIDHAIYRMEAAKSHYVYLVKQAKARGFRVEM